jgi:hypothetical protein
VVGDDEEMQRFVGIEDVFKGPHFDREIIVLCVSRYALTIPQIRFCAPAVM